MAVPKRRTSKARKRQRRAHHALTSPAHATCPTCQAPIIPHRMCASCGTYKGEVFVSTSTD
ncbi:MAG: 50S ribosomal protein L32 [Deltaproteobacteria bacterium]|nr:50S ribosomal protein L32 [Candidatus Anaeroferrophillus wilburensis]MBN2889033.1 50S ribosomal protein L32 [Deltaproteobacteria bacterium]